MTSLETRLRRFVMIRRIRCTVKLFFRLIALLLGILLILLIASAYAVTKIINSDSITSVVTANLQTFINQPIMLDSISINSLDKIEIKGFKITDTSDTGVRNMVYADSLILTYDFSSLFDKRIEILEIALERPMVHLLRRKDKSWNFDNIIITGKRDTRVKSAGSDFLSGFSIEPAANKITVNNGQFWLTDEANEGKNYIVDDVAFNLAPIVLGENSNIKATFTLPIAVSSATYPTEVSAAATLNIDPQAWAASYIKNAEFIIKSPKIITGDIILSADITDFINPVINAQFNLPIVKDTLISSFTKTNVDFSLPSSKWKAVVNVNRETSLIEISSVTVKADTLPLEAKGSFAFNGKSKDFSYRADLKLGKTDFKKVTSWWKFTKEYKLTGILGADTVVEGKGSDYKFGHLNIEGEDVSFAARGFKVSKMTGSLGITQDFNRYSYNINSADVAFGSQTVRNIKASGLYNHANDRFALYNLTSLLNDSAFSMTLDIASVRDDNKRNITTNIAADRFESGEVYNLVIDMRDALHISSSTYNYDESQSLAWLHMFKETIPEIMPKIKGGLYAKRFISTVLEGEDFVAEIDLTGLLPYMKILDGTVNAKINNAVVHTLAEMAEKEKALGVVYMPFLMMHRMERAGAFKVGQVLKDVRLNDLAFSCTFKNGNMQLNNFYADGNDLGAFIEGRVNWVAETLNINVYTLFKKRSGRGGLSETLTDESGLPALIFTISDKMSDPNIQMKSPKKTRVAIEGAKRKGLSTDFKNTYNFARQGELNGEKT